MTAKQFFAKYNNKFLDFDGKYGNQCVDLARFFIKEVLELPQPKGVGGAYQFFTDFEKDKVLTTLFDKIPNTLTFMPKEGDICLWNKGYGQYGHIAIATGKNTLLTFEVFSQNDPLKSPCIFKTYKFQRFKGDKTFLGVIRAKHLLEVWMKTNTMDSYDIWLKKLLNSLK